MFDNNCNIFSFSYEVQLDSIIKSLCDISFDIGKQVWEIVEVQNKQEGFTIADLFQNSFLQDISVRAELLTDQEIDGVTVKSVYTKDDFFSVITDYFNRALFNSPVFLNGLEGSDVIFINKEQKYYFGIGSKPQTRFIPALKKAKILKHLISNLKSEKIRNSLQKIDMFENDFFYQNAIYSSKLSGQPILSLLDMSFIDGALVEIIEVDTDNYWINFNYYNKISDVDLSQIDRYFIVLDKENKEELGILISQKLIVYANVDLIRYIPGTKIHEYYWLLLQNTYSQKNTVQKQKVDENIEEFKALIPDVELNQLLSFLKNNLYINNKDLIKDKFLKFFDAVVLLEKLDFLDGFEFLMSSNSEEESSLGIYSNIKKGTSYNLLHWLNYNRTSKINHFRGSTPIEKEKILIYTLKPAICYYFLEKYFEDLFESILKVNQYNYFANASFLEKGQRICEVDFFVKAKTRFFYFETKTKLTKLYIDEFLKKSSKMIDKFKPMIEHGIEIKFILIGGYSDENVKDYQYFIDECAVNKKNGYNIERLNLKCNPYYFNVPIPDKEGAQITCIAEPEYIKLQNLILQICQN